MPVPRDPVGNHRSEKGLDRTQDSDRERRRDKPLDRLIVEIRCDRLRHRQPCGKLRELRADGSQFHAREPAQQEGSGRAEHQRDQRAGHLLVEPAPEYYEQQTAQAHGRLRQVSRPYILYITYPFGDETGWHLHIQAEEILHLGGEYRQCYPAREPDHYRIRDEPEDRTHTAQTHHHQYHPGHDGGYHQSLHPVLGHNAGDYHDKGTGRAAYQVPRPSEDRDEETCHDRRNEPLLGRDPAGYAECYGERQRYDSYNHPRSQVRCERGGTVPAFSEQVEEFGSEHLAYT